MGQDLPHTSAIRFWLVRWPFFLGKQPNFRHQPLCSTQRRSLWLWNAGGAGRKEATQSLILLVNFTLRKSLKKIFLQRWAISFHREIQLENRSTKTRDKTWIETLLPHKLLGPLSRTPSQAGRRSWKPQGFALPFLIATWKEGEKKQQQKANAQCSLKWRVLLCLRLHRSSHRSAPKSGRPLSRTPFLRYPQLVAVLHQGLATRRGTIWSCKWKTTKVHHTFLIFRVTYSSSSINPRQWTVVESFLNAATLNEMSSRKV